MKIAIIGGGIGGLTTALVLKRAGIPFKLYEAAAVIKEVGTGIIMANNAMQIFRKLGIDQQVSEKGNLINSMSIVKADFSPLSIVSLKGFEKKYGVQNHAIHRADLHHILSEAVGSEHIEINKRLQEVKFIENHYSLNFEDGSKSTCEYLIGADGIRSQVRQQLFSVQKYRDAEQICWRGVADFTLPKKYSHEVIEVWSKGKRFGFVQIGLAKVYWYLVVDTALVNDRKEVTSFVADMHALAGQLVSATPTEKIIKTPLFDLRPMHAWVNDKACLIGDAAHASTPNLGQGACQAIEDAYVLGELLKKYPIREAFVKYPKIRIKKAHYIVNSSWKIGKIAQLKNTFGIAIRNFVLKRLTPDRVNLKQMDKIFKLDKIS